MENTYWLNIRGQFELPEDLVYLNNGSFGPSPRPVLDAVTKYIREVDANPGQNLGVYWSKLGEAKRKFGAFAGIEPADFVFITNLTVGMNMISHGLHDLGIGDEVLTTDQEYGAVNNAWEFASRKAGFTIVKARIPTPTEDTGQILDGIERAITPRTKALYFSHITTSTGLIMPVAEICAIARKRSIITAVDGAHAPGMIPLDIQSLGCDLYTGNCHKWLCAPKGTAILWASPEAQRRLDPFIVGWGWKRDEETFLGNFENPGTHSIALPVAVGDAVDFQLSIGRDRIANRGRELAAYVRERIGSIPGAIPLVAPELACSLTAFTLPGMDKDRLTEALKKRRIIVPNRATSEDTWLRVSTHVYNFPHEVDVLREALDEAMG